MAAVGFRGDDDAQRDRAEQLEDELRRQEHELRRLEAELRQKDAELEAVRAPRTAPHVPLPSSSGARSGGAEGERWSSFWRRADWGARVGVILGLLVLLIFVVTVLSGIGAGAYFLVSGAALAPSPSGLALSVCSPGRAVRPRVWSSRGARRLG